MLDLRLIDSMIIITIIFIRLKSVKKTRRDIESKWRSNIEYFWLFFFIKNLKESNVVDQGALQFSETSGASVAIGILAVSVAAVGIVKTFSVVGVSIT